MTYPRDHWSANQFMTWDLCPATYRERYVDGVVQLPTEPMLFGQAVHLGLEWHYRGGDGDKTFKHAAAAMNLRPELVASGLILLERVYDLHLVGMPEHEFRLDTEAVWGLPTTGFIDLVDPEHCMVFDFKTTVGTWSQTRADRDPWQPTLYRTAAHVLFGCDEELMPWRFCYVVMNRRTLEISTFEPSLPYDEAAPQCAQAGAMISKMVGAGAFPCVGMHGTCPECGELWQHEHACDFTVAPPRIHLVGFGKGRLA